jgi:hypothetical protein
MHDGSAGQRRSRDWESPITKKRFVVDKGGTNRHTANGALKSAGIDKKV